MSYDETCWRDYLTLQRLTARLKCVVTIRDFVSIVFQLAREETKSKLNKKRQQEHRNKNNKNNNNDTDKGQRKKVQLLNET